MQTMSFGPQVCGQLAEGGQREWLVPDGRGGYAMGTVSGLRTRRYHALLVVSRATTSDRQVGLLSLDPVLILPSGARIRLGTHEWSSGVVSPAGHEFLERFDLIDGLPRWRWRIGTVVIERELAMARGRACLGVVHRLIAGGPVTLGLDAICTWRDAHAERHASGPAPTMTTVADGVIVDGAYRLAGPGWQTTGEWWNGVFHREEASRQLAATEDVWYAGRFEALLVAPGDVIEVVADAGDPTGPAPTASAIVAAARERARSVIAAAKPVDGVGAALALAADTFVVDGATSVNVVAGYPWFGVWSRDTMTSYEGLFLDTGRADEGRELLRAYAATLSEGMLANTADTGELLYNTVDATLWFPHAIERHVTRTGDDDLAAELLPALHDILAAHVAGTRYGIRVDSDGLVTQGVPGEALTWMDARVDGLAVTPRIGKPVEVNALWVNGLAAVAELCRRTGTDPATAITVHDTARASFARRFPAPAGWLYDVLDGPDGDDASLRPNQLLAWSLPYAPLVPDAGTLTMIGDALLTPIGLRSLAPDAPGYRDTHRGGQVERDLAYHQGTVWAWLIGPYVEAWRKAGAARTRVPDGFVAHLREYGIGSIGETADGRVPHLGTGCPFQAWSVAQVLHIGRGDAA